MDPERWKQIERVCQTAIAMESSKRGAYLSEACQGDESLRREVEALLANVTEAKGFMKDPAMDVAAKVLAREHEDALARELIGRTVSHYRIVEKIGQGGMGEVFLADDMSLHRRVALKFLPPEMQQDAAAHRRFIREAHSAAALDHPYICHINEVGESEGRDFIVMEYVDGQTLRDRLAKGPLPLKEATKIASEVAEALEEAHEKRITHRDIKPANIMLTGKGHAKVMDFGLAKQAIPPGGVESQEEMVTALTRSGMALGTLAYMSPEQLRGEEVDARSDVFSFGIVLYEMLAGLHPFRKKTGMDTAGAILRDAPQPLAELRPDTPVLLQHIARKMLAKDPRDRYQSIHEVQTDLRELIEESDRPAQGKRQRMKSFYWIAAGSLVVVGAVIWAVLRFFPREAAVFPTKIIPVTTSGGAKGDPSLSPDGNWVAFAWNGGKQNNWDIYIKELDGTGENRLTTDPALDCCPAWSPDNRQIAFLRSAGDRWALYLISALGGGGRKLAEVFGERVSWSPDGRSIAFADRRSANDPLGIWLLSVETLEKKQMTAPDVDYGGDHAPAFSPDGRYLAFHRFIGSGRSALYVMGLPHGEPKYVTDFNSPASPCWTADSREIIFATQMETAEFGLWRTFVEGGVPHRIPARGEWASQPAISRNRLAYVNITGNTDIRRLELTDNEQMKLPAKPLLSWSSIEHDLCVSPDGSRIAFGSQSSGSDEIWVCNADGTKPMKLTDLKAGAAGSPSWSPDGKIIAFDSTKTGNTDIYVVSAEAGPVRRITTDTTDEVVPRWSRDGRWFYFGSNRSGSWQIWKMPSDGGKAIQISRDGGMVSRESADEQFVYYCGFVKFRNRGIWRVPVSGGPETLVLDKAINPHRWDLTGRGIYFIDDDAKPAATICFYDFAARLVRSLAPVDMDPLFALDAGVSVSPDSKWLIYCGGIIASDIMMIDNFR